MVEVITMGSPLRGGKVARNQRKTGRSEKRIKRREKKSGKEWEG